MRVVSGGVLVVALVLALRALTTAQTPSAFILGQVVDAGTNRPIPGAVVAIAGTAPEDPADAPQATGGTTRARRVIADGQGRFLFRGLAAGTYTLAAKASSYLDGGYGQRRPASSSQPFTIAEGDRVGDLTIRLWKEATLTGRVLDDLGEPVINVWVHLAHRDVGGGRIRVHVPRLAAAYASQTDDRGVYRFGSLAPGTYIVSVPSRLTAMPAPMIDADKRTLEALRASGSQSMAMGMGGMSPALRLGDFIVQTSNQGTMAGSNVLLGRLPFSTLPDARIAGYPTTFHPGGLSPSEAAAIALKPGEDRAGVDVQLRPVTMQRLTGTVVGPNGPEATLAVHLIPAYAAGGSLERVHLAAVTPTDARGAFAFPAVAPGQYVLRAWRLTPAVSIGSDPLPAEPTLWGEAPVAIGDKPPPPVTLTLQPGLTLSGRVEFDGTAAPPRPQQLQPTLAVAFEPAWPLAFGNLLATRVNDKYEFTTQGVPPGRYFADLPNPRFALTARGWHFESATLGDKDLTVSPLTLDGQNAGGIVIRFSDRQTMLSGTVLAGGKPDPNAAVVVFPADYESWIRNGMPPAAARAVAASQSGAYAIAGLKPGEYLAAAVGIDLLDNWPDAAAIERIAARAASVMIARGESRRVDLRSSR